MRDFKLANLCCRYSNVHDAQDAEEESKLNPKELATCGIDMISCIKSIKTQ